MKKLILFLNLFLFLAIGISAQTNNAPVAVSDTATVEENAALTSIDVIANDTDSDSFTDSKPIITLIVDGDCGGEGVKLFEIYASGTVDFSLYSFQVQINNSTTWNRTVDLTDLGIITNDFVYIVNTQNSGVFQLLTSDFPSITSSTPVLSTYSLTNGDDRVRIILTSDMSVIDQYGVTGTDGTGESWEYKDSYAKRIDYSSADLGFVESNWVIPGVNSLDGLGVCQGGSSLETLIGGIGIFSSNTSNTLTLTAVNTSGSGTVAVNADGVSVDYTPALNFNGIETVTYTVSDGELTDTTGTLTITVSPTNGGQNWSTDDLPLEGLIAYYPFNGNANDESGNGNSGSVNGAILTSDRFGNENNGYKFDGLDDFITTEAVLGVGQFNVTFSFWANSNATDFDMSILSQDCGDDCDKVYNLIFNKFLNSANVCEDGHMFNSPLSFAYGEPAHYGAVNFQNQNSWNHYVLVIGENKDYSYQNFKFYINGNQVQTDCDHNWGGWQVDFPNYPLLIGKKGLDGFFNGEIDDIGIWNRSLTQQEITDMFLVSTVTPITDANFYDAINTCLTTNPVDGLCASSEYGAMPVWDVSQVTDMSAAFKDLETFNADLSIWNVSNVVSMRDIFYSAGAFNQDISSWNVSNVTIMINMFHFAYSFNQDISSWNVSNVTNMWALFSGASSFNQDLRTWNVGSATNMGAMFENSLFNYDLGTWDISQVTDMVHMFDNAGLSTENYDSILTGWSALTLQPNVIFGAVGVSYCESESARQSIIDTYGWNITDGGQNCSIDNLPLDGLLAYYPFNGNANDEIGPNDGTAFGASLTSDRFGNSNSAYEFNGTSDFISLEEPFFNGSSSVSNFTYSTWIYVNQYPSSTQIISGKEGYWRTITLEMNSNGSVQFKGSQPSPQAYHIIETAADKIILQDWNHIAVTFANETLKIYVNGSLEQTEILSIDSWDFSWLAAGNSSDTNLFGAANPISGGVQYHFEGKIDDFALWNRSFSAAEISNLNNNTLATDKLKLVNSFSVYPNPVNKDLNIQLAADSSFIKCEVYNLLGQVVLESKQTKFSVKDLPAATYFIKVFTENGQVVNRFIKK